MTLSTLQVSSKIFEKAIDEPQNSMMYADLVQLLHDTQQRLTRELRANGTPTAAASIRCVTETLKDRIGPVTIAVCLFYALPLRAFLPALPELRFGLTASDGSSGFLVFLDLGSTQALLRWPKHLNVGGQPETGDTGCCWIEFHV